MLCLVVDRGMLLAAAGAVLGSAGAFAASRVLKGMLFGAASTHVAVMFGVRAGPIGVAALASYLPARRATRVDPTADGKRVTAKDLELTDTLSALPPQTLKEARESMERELVQDALRRHRGKVTSTTLELGISRPKLYELMEKPGIARDS